MDPNDPALAGLLRPVRISGINAIGLESDNAPACAGRTLPWLQDVQSVDVWTSWQANWRDVIILDAQNVPFATYNLTTHDLANPVYYAELRTLLVNAASAP